MTKATRKCFSITLDHGLASDQFSRALAIGLRGRGHCGRIVRCTHSNIAARAPLAILDSYQIVGAMPLAEHVPI